MCEEKDGSGVEITTRGAADICLDRSHQILEHPSVNPIRWSELNSVTETGRDR